MPFFNILYYLLTIITNIHVFGNFYLYNNNSSHEINTNFATIDPEATVVPLGIVNKLISIQYENKTINPVNGDSPLRCKFNIQSSSSYHKQTEEYLNLNSSNNRSSYNNTGNLEQGSYHAFNNSNVHVNQSSQNYTKTTTINSRPFLKSSVWYYNYASYDCNAKVLEANKESKTPRAILLESKDRYMLNECDAPERYFVVQLCEGIRLEYIILANYEYFSSTFKHFTVYASKIFPADHWTKLADFIGQNTKSDQSFALPWHDEYFSYIKLVFHDYYGSNYYCPISSFQVSGKTMLNDFHGLNDSFSEPPDNLENLSNNEEAINVLYYWLDLFELIFKWWTSFVMSLKAYWSFFWSLINEYFYFWEDVRHTESLLKSPITPADSHLSAIFLDMKNVSHVPNTFNQTLLGSALASIEKIIAKQPSMSLKYMRLPEALLSQTHSSSCQSTCFPQPTCSNSPLFFIEKATGKCPIKDSFHRNINTYNKNNISTSNNEDSHTNNEARRESLSEPPQLSTHERNKIAANILLNLNLRLERLEVFANATSSYLRKLHDYYVLNHSDFHQRTVKEIEERHKLFFKTFLPQLEEIKLLIVALEFLFRQNAREIFNINDKLQMYEGYLLVSTALLIAMCAYILWRTRKSTCSCVRGPRSHWNQDVNESFG